MSQIKSVNAECSFFIFADRCLWKSKCQCLWKRLSKRRLSRSVSWQSQSGVGEISKFRHRIAMCITQPRIVAIFAFSFHAYSPFVFQREFELPHRKFDNHHSRMTEFVSSTGTNHRLWPSMPAPMYQDSIRGCPIVQMCSRFVCMCAYVCVCRRWR